MIVRAIKTSVFKEGDNLQDFIVPACRHLPAGRQGAGDIKQLLENSVLVVTSKIVALSEGRTAEIDGDPSTSLRARKQKEELIKRESDFAIKTKYCWLTIKDGVVMASAGIDESNANGKLILLPKDSYKAAGSIRKFLQKKYKIKNLGILITDSRTIPLRAGIVGMALGYAGFKGTKDYRGKPDIFKRKFHFSRTDIADSLAASATLVMGEGAEQQPLAIITDAPIEFCDKVSRKDLQIDLAEDMYYPLFSKLSKKGVN